MARPKLFMMFGSPPVRAVLMTARAIGLKFELHEVDVTQKQQLRPEFLKLNPQHTIPTLVEEDGFTIWDSHAIQAYIVEKYAEDDSLYPKDLKKRAVVDQRLHFDSGILFGQVLQILPRLLFGGKKTMRQVNIDGVNTGYEFLEAFLEGNKWMTGNSVTIADISIFSSVTSLSVLVPLDKSKYKNLTSWLKRFEGLPFSEENRRGLEEFRTGIQSRL